ncbi:MAG: pentapeptide repeat-containing protein [Lysobacterales bacterium]
MARGSTAGDHQTVSQAGLATHINHQQIVGLHGIQAGNHRVANAHVDGRLGGLGVGFGAALGSAGDGLGRACRSLAGCYLARCSLASCSLASCNLASCSLASCSFASCSFASCSLGGCRLGSGRLDSSRLDSSRLGSGRLARLARGGDGRGFDVLLRDHRLRQIGLSHRSASRRSGCSLTGTGGGRRAGGILGLVFCAWARCFLDSGFDDSRIQLPGARGVQCEAASCAI